MSACDCKTPEWCREHKECKSGAWQKHERDQQIALDILREHMEKPNKKHWRDRK